MAATNMSKAGLEPGCLVEFLHPDNIRGSISDREYERILELRAHNPWTFLQPKNDTYMTLEQRDVEPGEMPATVDAHREDFTRQYNDAQTARQARFTRLLEMFPGDAGVPTDTETIERYVCVQRNEDPTSDGTFAFQWGDTFSEAVEQAGGEILDGWFPRGVYDLDTGEKIDVHVSSPVITRSEDQGATVNELDPGQLAESQQFVSHNYDVIAHSFTVSATVPPDRGDEFAAVLDTVCSASYVEQANVRRNEIRQVKGSGPGGRATFERSRS